MQNTKPDNLIIGYTPELMQEMGMPSIPFVIGTGHVYSAAKTEAEAKQDGNYRKGVHYHGLGADVVKNIYEQLQDPVMIIAAKDVNKNAAPLRSTHSVVAIVDIGQAGSSLLLPVEITAERSVGGQRMDVNVLSSIYERSVIPLIKEAVALENSGDVGIYYAKKEATNLIGAGVRFPVQLQAQMASNPIIRSFDAKVNRNISDATQSQQFKRWFGDWQNHPESASKVVNADGTPKVVYHGTNSKDFYVFDSSRSDKRVKLNTLGDVYYFTSEEETAKRYGERVMALYLDIKKPYRVYARDGGIRAQMADDFHMDADSISRNDIQSILRANGYDGVLLYRSKYDADSDFSTAVAFSNTQIKSATDNIGTFDGTNPDIRYSKRSSEERYSYKALAEKPDMTLTVLGGQIPGSRADIVALAKKNAAKVGKFDPYTGSVSVHVNDIDTDVLLSTDGLKHGLRRTKDIRANVNALVTLQAGEIIKNSIRVNELVPSKQNASGSFVLIGSARDGDGHLYVVRSVINQFELTSMDVLYAMNAKRVESAALNAPRSATMPLSVTDSTQKDPAALNAPEVSTPLTGPTISIADLLDVVNRNFPDILPESVLRHFGHTERPGGDLGESALFSKRGTSNRALLVNALNSAVSSDIEQERLTQYRKNIDMLDAEQKKLAELRAEIRTLSFAEGKRDKAALKALQDEATRTENRITNYDRRLLNLEATAPLKALLLRERTKARKAAEQRGKEALAEYRKKSAQRLGDVLAHNRAAREQGVDSRKRTELRRKIRRVVSELNQLLLNGTKDRHVMIDWQKSTAEALAAVNMDTLSADSRLEALAQKIDEATDPAVREKLQATYARLEEQNDNMTQRLDALRKAYDGIRGSEDPLIQNVYHPEIDDRIKSLRDQVGDTPLRDMSRKQLQEVYDTYRMVLTTIRNANKAFKAARGESIAQLGEAVKREVLEAGGVKDKRAKLIKRFDRFYWDGMKPVYAFKAIGSKTLSGLFDNVRAGEDTWAVDVNEARDFFRESAKKHGYKSWNFDERYPFVSKSGKEFSLSLGQMLSLYAYSKREQAAPHLEEGGFVFDGNIEIVEKHKGIPVKYEVNTADAYRLSRDTLAEIVGTLTDEQIAFVDDMQGYLSDTMAEKGNEVALAMYGVKLFGEKHYFPLKTAKQFMFEKSEPAGEVRLRNAGFTQKTVDHATSPILLNDFMTVWGNHVNDMSMYHAFVLPIEDFNRVFNYAPYTQNADRKAVKQYIENAYGKQPVQYIRRLLTDINGGARIDPTADLPNRMLGMFKKSAVFASASVVVQQPSAIARAFALVDPKYFATKPFSVKQHSAEWAEVKKYAPVAVIKEMGYFDTNMGKSTVDYITAAEYSGFKEKAAALIKDSGYRDEVLSKAHGVTKEKIAAIITHVGMYVGWPKAWAVFRLAQAVWNEETSAETAKERYQNRIFFPVGAPNDAFAAYFIGQSYIAPVSTAQVPVFNVTFEPGCRNNRHIHHAKSGGGQLLICVGGRGFYQKWGKPPVEMTPGTVVNIPAGVKHWHGAAADEWFSHLAVEVPGEETRNEWLEAVDDGQYLHAVQPEKAE